MDGDDLDDGTLLHTLLPGATVVRVVGVFWDNWVLGHEGCLPSLESLCCFQLDLLLYLSDELVAKQVFH